MSARHDSAAHVDSGGLDPADRGTDRAIALGMGNDRNRADLGAAAAAKARALVYLTGRGLRWVLEEAIDLKVASLSPAERKRFDAVLSAGGSD